MRSSKIDPVLETERKHNTLQNHANALNTIECLYYVHKNILKRPIIKHTSNYSLSIKANLITLPFLKNHSN